MLLVYIPACAKLQTSNESKNQNTIADNVEKTNNYKTINDEEEELDESPNLTNIGVKSEVINNLGNASGNIANGGTVVEVSRKVLLTMPEDITLTAFDSEQGESNTISKDYGTYINVFNEKIFFINAADEYRIYSIDIDGSNKMRIGNVKDCQELVLVGAELFYIDGHDNNCIYSMSIDGKVTRKVVEDNCLHFTVFSNKIYYTTDNNGDYSMYSVNFDGSQKIEIYDSQATMFTIEKEKIIFSDGKVIRKMNLDGTEIQDIYTAQNDTWIVSINFDGDNVYFINNKKMYKIKNDGEECESIVEDYTPKNIHIVGNWIYFVTTSYEDYVESHEYYRVPKDGGKVEKVIGE